MLESRATINVKFTYDVYADIQFVCEFCDGNARAAVVEYRRRSPIRRHPRREGFNNVNQQPRDGIIHHKYQERGIRPVHKN